MRALLCKLIFLPANCEHVYEYTNIERHSRGFQLNLSSAERIGSGHSGIEKKWVAGRFGSNGSIDIFDQVFLGTFNVHSGISEYFRYHFCLYWYEFDKCGVLYLKYPLQVDPIVQVTRNIG